MSATSLFRAEVATAMAVALALGVLLLAIRPKDRASTRNALVLLVVCAVAGAADTLVGSMGARSFAGILADASTVLAGVVLIRLVGILVFRVLLPAVRVSPARIVEDLVTAALMIAWGLVWLRVAGVDLGSLITTSAVITGVVAFSMSMVGTFLVRSGILTSVHAFAVDPDNKEEVLLEAFQFMPCPQQPFPRQSHFRVHPEGIDPRRFAGVDHGLHVLPMLEQ